MGQLVTANQFQLVPNIPGAISQGINLGNQFRDQQLQQKQQEFLASGGLQKPGALQQSGKLGLDFQQKVAQSLKEKKSQDISEPEPIDDIDDLPPGKDTTENLD